MVASLRLPTTVEVLRNGLTVVISEDHRAPVVATMVRLDRGAAQEHPVGSGVAHLFEHLMYEGTPAVPGQGYDDALAEAGGDNNAWTDHDATAFHAVVPEGALERLLYLEADRLGHLQEGLTEDNLDNQLAVVHAEAALTDEAPHQRDLDAVLAAVFGPEHPYGGPVHGDPELRNALTLPQVAAWVAQATDPGGVTLAIVGDVDTATVLSAVRSRFGALAQGPRRAVTAPPAPAPRGPARWSFAGAARRSTLYLAWPIPPDTHVDRPLYGLLASVLVEGREGPLARALPGRLVDAWSWTGASGGVFVVEVARDAPLDHTERATRAAWPEALERATADAGALTRAQRRLRLQRLRALEDPLQRVEALATCVGRGQDTDCAADALARALAATPADLAAVAAELTLDGATVVGVSDRAEQALTGATPLELWP